MSCIKYIKAKITQTSTTVAATNGPQDYENKNFKTQVLMLLNTNKIKGAK